MIHHIVMCTLKAGYDCGELDSVMQGLETLREHHPGFIDFAHGPNRDFEGLSPDCTYAFIGQFSDASALKHYAEDPGHQALGQRLLALCAGGRAGLRVVDMDVAQ